MVDILAEIISSGHVEVVVDADPAKIEMVTNKGDPGEHGPGWTSGEYSSSTGVVTFTSNDGLGFATDDLRGADSTVEGPKGDGWTGGSYDAGTGVFTFTSDDSLGFSTDDLRGADSTVEGPAGLDADWTQITQADYDALSPPDPNTLYVIVG